jgi:histidinol-phosphate aminotransferase
MTTVRSLNRREWLRTAALGAFGLGLATRGRIFAADDFTAPVVPGKREFIHVNLAGNENPLGPSPAVMRAIFRAAPESSRYPFREEIVLKELLAKREGVEVDNIVLGNGCDEILALTAAAHLGIGTNLIAARPTYFQITDYAEKLGAEIRWVPHVAATMQHDLKAMAAALDARTRLVYVCNPDNPSGTSRPAAEVTAFCREVAPRAPVFLDEVYLELADDFAAQTQVPLVREGLPVIIGRSFSKMYGLAGHRIGYAVTTPKLAQTLGKLQMSSVNFLGVAAARAAVEDAKWAEWSRKKVRETRTRFCALLDELKLRYTPSEGNFIFHYTGTPMKEFQDRMEARGFLVGWPHPAIAPYEKWCRISMGTDEEMAAYAKAMREEFKGGRT